MTTKNGAGLLVGIAFALSGIFVGLLLGLMGIALNVPRTPRKVNTYARAAEAAVLKRAGKRISVVDMGHLMDAHGVAQVFLSNGPGGDWQVYGYDEESWKLFIIDAAKAALHGGLGYEVCIVPVNGTMTCQLHPFLLHGRR